MDRSVLEHTKCPLIDTENLDNMWGFLCKAYPTVLARSVCYL